MKNCENIKYFIYLITNNINDKVYVGLTRRTIEARFKQHIYMANSIVKKGKCKINEAMKNIGVENFKIEKLEECNSEKTAFAAETFYIKKYNSLYHENGYNVSQGASGSSHRLKYESEYVINILIDYCNDMPRAEISKKHNIKDYSVPTIINSYNFPYYNVSDELKNKVKSKLEERKNKSPITADTVINILNDYISKKYNIPKLAIKYNLSCSNLNLIINREIFKNIYVSKSILKKIKEARLFHKNEKIKKGSKLSDEIIKNIFKDYSSGLFKVIDLEFKYNISRNSVYRILRRTQYKFVKIEKNILKNTNDLLKKKKTRSNKAPYDIDSSWWESLNAEERKNVRKRRKLKNAK